MSAELRVTFLGEHQDAHKALTGLRRLLAVVNIAEALSSRGGKRSTWRFAHLSLGSVEAGVAQLERPPGAVTAEFTFLEIIDGFDEAEQREGVPSGWNAELARQAHDLIAVVDTDGLEMRLLSHGEAVRTSRITSTARRHLEAGLREDHRDSVGSVIGQLDSVSVHDKHEARVWPERGGPSVLVKFKSDQVGQVKDHLGARVEASGLLRRDAFGQIVHLELSGLQRLPGIDASPPLSALIGLDPEFTDGMSAEEYLREVRGEAR